MALVTYVLLSGLASGLQSRFHPEVLGSSFFKAMAVVVLEFCIIKLGVYLLDVKGSGASGVELIGYGGYKFVGYVYAAQRSQRGTHMDVMLILQDHCHDSRWIPSIG